MRGEAVAARLPLVLLVHVLVEEAVPLVPLVHVLVEEAATACLPLVPLVHVLVEEAAAEEQRAWRASRPWFRV